MQFWVHGEKVDPHNGSIAQLPTKKRTLYNLRSICRLNVTNGKAAGLSWHTTRKYCFTSPHPLQTQQLFLEAKQDLYIARRARTVLSNGQSRPLGRH